MVYNINILVMRCANKRKTTLVAKVSNINRKLTVHILRQYTDFYNIDICRNRYFQRCRS